MFETTISCKQNYISKNEYFKIENAFSNVISMLKQILNYVEFIQNYKHSSFNVQKRINTKCYTKHLPTRFLQISLICFVIHVFASPVVVNGAFNTLHTSTNVHNASKTGGEFIT